MDNSFRLSLENIEKMQEFFPQLGRFASRALVQSKEDFISVFYQDIDNIIFTISQNPELRHEDSEDRLTIEIVGMLKQLGYTANHDKKIGGHTDITIEWKTYLWIGEAKIYNGCSYIYQGFQQLTTRYSIGTVNQDYAGIIIYIKQPKMFQIMEKWKSYLPQQREDLKIKKCHFSDDCFISIHEHDRSGKPFYVRHMPISLYFSPQDR